MRCAGPALLIGILLLSPTLVRPAAAQLIPDWDSQQFRIEQLDADRLRLTGQVEVEGQGANK